MGKINGLDIFTGIGGITLALKKWVRPIAYVEIEPYCQKVLLERMADGSLCKAPIWDDITSFRSNPICSFVDIIYGGFPCQGFSVAGSGKGLEDERSGLFYEMLRLAKEIKPAFIFLENVPAITKRGGVEVVNEITKMGYDCRWLCISAASVGAPHKRERWFLLAYSNSKSSIKTNKVSKPLEAEGRARVRSPRHSWNDQPATYWTKNKPPICGMDDELPHGMDRLKALGNAVVPQQTKEAFEILIGLK